MAALREVAWRLQSAVKQTTRAVNRLHNLTARTFPEQLPLPYPSYPDPDSEIAELIEAPRNFPSTAFYDRDGELVYTFQGVYSSQEQLAGDIARYAR